MASSSVGVFEELRRPGDRELFAERTLVAKAAAGDRAAFAEPYPDALLDADPLRRLERRAGIELALVVRYVEAWEAADVEALVSLLREDARMTMPPTPSWYLGRDAIGTFFASFFASEAGTDTYLSPTRANRQPALAVYTRGAATEPYRPLAVKVLTLDGDAIAAITGFTDPRLFGYFGLSSRR